MSGRGTAFAVTSLVAMLGLAGCGTDEDWSHAAPENQGYHWVGSGEPGNFASAYGFCRSTLSADTEGQQLQDASGPVITRPGGPTTIPGYQRSFQTGRSNVVPRSQFKGCMESQGWAVNQPAPEPVSAPAPTTPSPST